MPGAKFRDRAVMTCSPSLDCLFCSSEFAREHDCPVATGESTIVNIDYHCDWCSHRFNCKLRKAFDELKKVATESKIDLIIKQVECGSFNGSD
jgi:DNA-directed RNA polymerase subunit RPC12/RpoP